MIVRYRIGVADVIAEAQECLNANFQRSAGFVRFFMAILLGSLMYGAFSDYSTAVAVSVGVASAVLVVFATRRSARRGVMSHWATAFAAWEDPIELGDRELTLTAEGFEEDAHFGSRTIQWKAVKRVRVTSSHIFAHVGPLTALTIPLDPPPDGASTEKLSKALANYAGVELEQS